VWALRPGVPIGCRSPHKGSFLHAETHQAADDGIAAGRRLNDPQSIGFGSMILAWTAIASNDYEAALNFAETGLSTAQTPFVLASAKNARIVSLVLLRRPGAFAILREWRDQCLANGWLYHLSTLDGMKGVALVLRGEIGRGIREMERAILTCEQQGARSNADWMRLILSETYLEIISRAEKPSAMTIFKNLLVLARITMTAQRRIIALVDKVRQNSHFDPDGFHIGRCEMTLGLLYKTKRRQSLAMQHLSVARRIISQFGASAMLAKIDAALGELA
jgi:hypothetical protein